MASNATAYSMKEKDKLDIVKTVQEVLIKKGYLKGKATGYCGTDTVAAVKAFQKANNLTVEAWPAPRRCSCCWATDPLHAAKAAERSAAFLYTRKVGIFFAYFSFSDAPRMILPGCSGTF